MTEEQSRISEPFSVEINASVALKLAQIGQKHYPGTSSGPLYGFDDQEERILNISHIINFPNQHTSGDDVFNTKSSNAKFQADFQTKLNDSKIGVKLLGWFMTATKGKQNRQTVVESMLRLQKKMIEEEKSTLPVIFVIYDPSKSTDSLLSLQVLKLSDAFVKTWNSEARFAARNLIDNRLTYRNIFEEVPSKIRNSNLTDLKIQELDVNSEYGNELELTSNYLKITTQTSEQLIDAIDNFNHNLGNFNYFQRSLSRELTKINQWKLRAKQEHLDHLKTDPTAEEPELDWKEHYKLPQVPSKYEHVVSGGLLSSLCNNVSTTGSVEHAKTTGIQKSLDL